MKKIKSFFWVLIFCLTILSCNKTEVLNGVRVKFYNETGFNIEELNIGNKVIGSLEINTNTNYLIYEKFGFDTGMPDTNCNGKIVNETIESYNGFYWCGTEKSFVEEGIYEMSIKLVEIDSTKYFRIDLK